MEDLKGLIEKWRGAEAGVGSDDWEIGYEEGKDDMAAQCADELEAAINSNCADPQLTGVEKDVALRFSKNLLATAKHNSALAGDEPEADLPVRLHSER